MRKLRHLTGLAVVATALAACGSSSTTLESSSRHGAITVFAATSLTNAMTDLETAFEAANPGVDLILSFGASSALAQSLSEGAPADIFASADTKNMEFVASNGHIESEVERFATNRLEIMVGAGNPKAISGLSDLASPDVKVATGADDVPIRQYTDSVLTKAGVVAHFVTFEANVGAIVTKVRSGEVDAGIVYHTDVIAAGSDAVGVTIPNEFNVVAHYPIAVLRASTNRSLAQSFVDFVLSGPGQSILRTHGFGSP